MNIFLGKFRVLTDTQKCFSKFPFKSDTERNVSSQEIYMYIKTKSQKLQFPSLAKKGFGLGFISFLTAAR